MALMSSKDLGSDWSNSEYVHTVEIDVALDCLRPCSSAAGCEPTVKVTMVHFVLCLTVVSSAGL